VLVFVGAHHRLDALPDEAPPPPDRALVANRPRPIVPPDHPVWTVTGLSAPRRSNSTAGRIDRRAVWFVARCTD